MGGIPPYVLPGYGSMVPMYYPGMGAWCLCIPWYIPTWVPSLPVYTPGYTRSPSMPHWVSALHRPWRTSNTLGSKRQKGLGEGLPEVKVLKGVMVERGFCAELLLLSREINVEDWIDSG